MLTLIDNESEMERNNKLIADFYMGLTEIDNSKPIEDAQLAKVRLEW